VAIVVGVGFGHAGGSNGTVSATCDGNAMTLLGSVNNAGGNAGETLLFGIANQASGAHTIVVSETGSAGSRTWEAGSVSYSGADTSAPFGTAVTKSGSSTGPNVTVTGTTSGNMVAGVASIGSDTLTNPATSRWVANFSNSNGAGNAGQADKAAGGSITLTWSGDTSDDWGAVAVEVKAAAGGSTFSLDVSETITATVTAGTPLLTAEAAVSSTITAGITAKLASPPADVSQQISVAITAGLELPAPEIDVSLGITAAITAGTPSLSRELDVSRPVTAAITAGLPSLPAGVSQQITAAITAGISRPAPVLDVSLPITAGITASGLLAARLEAVRTITAVVLADAGPDVPAQPVQPFVPSLYVSIEGHDGALSSLGPIDEVTLDATLYYNGVGSWAIAVPYSDQLWDMVSSADFGVTIDWGGYFRFGGKCESPGYQYALPGSTFAAAVLEGAYIIISGATYEALIANRIAFPNPAAAWSGQSAAGADAVTSVPLETAIKHYVNVNAGPGAISGRKVPILSVATDAGRGGTVSYSAQFTDGVDLNLMDIIRTLVATGGPMGVQVTDNGSGGLVFDTYVPRDLSGYAYFSERLGNLVSISFALADPLVTNALVQGASGAFTEVTGDGSSDWWTRVEQYVDQTSSTDATQVTQAGQDAIAQGAATPQLSITTIDIPALVFGRDYFLGDRVTVETRNGDTVTDIISQVDLTIDPMATPPIWSVPTIGYPQDPGAADPSFSAQLLANVRRLERRLDAQRG
jgi:hypothetical protein